MTDRERAQSEKEARAAELLLGGALQPPSPPGACPSAETLAAFVDGRVTGRERDEVVAHLAQCEDCRAVVSGVASLTDEFDRVDLKPLPAQRSRDSFLEWVTRHRAGSMGALAAAAMLVVAAWAGVRFMAPERRLERALARMDAIGDIRPVQARLVGANYRPAPPTTRAAVADAEPPLDVRNAANAVEGVATGMPEALAARALAQVQLTKGRPDRAVDAIARFVTGSRDASLLSDASAAYLARGLDADLVQALNAAARAVDIDPNLAAGWFNLGLAAAALGQQALAAQAWDQVIRLEPNSGWAREAAKRKAELPKRQSWQPKDESEFRAAIERGDDEAAARVADRWLSDARLLFEGLILTEVGKHWTSPDRSALRVAADRAEVAGRALNRVSLDRWPVDVASQLRKLVRAADAATTLDPCVPGLLNVVPLRSAEQWALAVGQINANTACHGGVPAALSLHTRFLVLRNELANLQASPDLTNQLAEVGRTAGRLDYFELQGRALSAEGWLLARQSKSLEAIALYTAAEESAQRGKHSDVETAQVALRAEVQELFGAYQGAWRDRFRALPRLYTVSSPQRLFTIYRDLIRACVNQSLYDAALLLLHSALASVQRAPDLTLRLLTDRAALLSYVDRLDEAAVDIQSALDLLPNTGASVPRESFERSLLKSQALIRLESKPAEAIKALTRLIDASDPTKVTFELPELLFLRASAHARVAGLDSAERDYQKGFQLLEQRQQNLPDHFQPAALDRSWDAIASAIRLQAVTRGDHWAGLVVAERARAASLTARVGAIHRFEGPELFQRELPPSVGVVFLSMLDDAVLSWAMTSKDKLFTRVPIRYAELTRLAHSFRRALEADSPDIAFSVGRRLYDLALAPYADLLSGVSTLVIVPDGPWLSIPFSALVRGDGRLVVEDYAVSVAPNLRLYRTLSARLRDPRDRPSAVTFGDPRGGPGLPWQLRPLNAAANEARQVAALYGAQAFVGAEATRAAFLDGLRRHNVIHFAGHAIVSTSQTATSLLVLAPSDGDSGLVSPSAIDPISLLPGTLVVLAGCDTADGATFRGEGLMGLVRPFIAAGGASVVANLWPVDDDMTVEFMREFHREVWDGVAPALALQRIQKSFASQKLPARTWAGWIAVGGYQ